jgi:hypothetical protein
VPNKKEDTRPSIASNSPPTNVLPLRKVVTPAQAEDEIDAESYKLALERTRANERAEGATFPGQRSFLIPSSDDYDEKSPPNEPTNK